MITICFQIIFAILIQSNKDCIQTLTPYLNENILNKAETKYAFDNSLDLGKTGKFIGDAKMHHFT